MLRVSHDKMEKLLDLDGGLSAFLSKIHVPHNYSIDVGLIDDNTFCVAELPGSAISSPVTTESKVSFDSISNNDNKETGSTDTVSKVTVVTDSVSDEEAILSTNTNNASEIDHIIDEEIELESEDESDDDAEFPVDDIINNIEFPEYTEVETTDSLKACYSSENSSYSSTIHDNSSIEPVESRLTDNNNLLVSESWCDAIVSKSSSFFHSIINGIINIVAPVNTAASEGPTFYTSLESDEVKNKEVDVAGDMSLNIGKLSTL